jgi:hypothetical protein
MRLRLLLTVVLLSAGVGTAAADPTKSPMSVTIVAACDSGQVALTVLTMPPSAAAWTVSTRLGISVDVTVTDEATGGLIFQFDNPGFDKNVVATETCVVTVPGVIVTIEAFFTPATR